MSECLYSSRDILVRSLLTNYLLWHANLKTHTHTHAHIKTKNTTDLSPTLRILKAHCKDSVVPLP